MKIKELRRNVVRALVAFAGLNVFTACYGVPYYYWEGEVKGTVVDVDDCPVPGIEVNCQGYGHIDTTDAYGKFSKSIGIDTDHSGLWLEFVDIDGPENGEFQNFEQMVPFEMADNVKVTLEKK